MSIYIRLNLSRVIHRKQMYHYFLLLTMVALLLSACTQKQIRQGEKQHVVIREKPAQVVVTDEVQEKFKQAVALLQQKPDDVNTQKAIDLLTAVIADEKQLPAPYVDLAMAYLRQSGDASLRDKRAEENLISALKLEIGHPVANNELGLLYRKEGRFKAARVAYQNAINAHPDYLPAKINLGVLCDLYMHDYQCALKQYRDYLKYRPNDKKVKIWAVDVTRRLAGK